MKKIVSIAAVMAVAAILPARLIAGFVYFDNRNDFEAALGGAPSGFEGFQTSFVPAASVDFPIGGPTEFSLSESAGGGIFHVLGLGGNNFAGYSDDDSIATFDFVSPINAFGLDIRQFASATETVTVGGDVSTSFDLPNFTPTFFGVINDMGGTLQQITFDVSGSGFFVDFDAVSYGLEGTSSNVVPEPSSVLVWSLLGLTLGGCTWLRRRHR